MNEVLAGAVKRPSGRWLNTSSSLYGAEERSESAWKAVTVRWEKAGKKKAAKKPKKKKP